MYQQLLMQIAECSGVDSLLIQKRLTFWLHELQSNFSSSEDTSEKIHCISQFLFKNLYLQASDAGELTDIATAFQERKCHPLILACLYCHFSQMQGLTSFIAYDSQFRYVKILGEGNSWIVNLKAHGRVLTPKELLESLKTDCNKNRFEPIDVSVLAQSVFDMILNSHQSKSNWPLALKTLNLRNGLVKNASFGPNPLAQDSHFSWH